MQRTEHYNLSKPEREDPFRAQDVADNLDAIDEAIHNAAESGTASVDGMDIKPASVAATGDVADATGTLDQVRQDSKSASNITSGTLPVARGGTGASTAAAARTNLGITAANVVDGNAIAPSSVAATGAVSGSSVSDSVGSLADLRDSVSLKTMQLTKTTTASGIFGTGLVAPNAVVYGFKTSLAYRCIPYIATDGYWNVIVLKPQAAQEAATNVSVSGTVYYI